MAAQNSVLTQIARPYASALFDLAESENQLASVETSLSDVSRLIGESADFSRFLRSPVIAGDDKAKALDALLAKGKTNALVANFLKLSSEVAGAATQLATRLAQKAEARGPGKAASKRADDRYGQD